MERTQIYLNRQDKEKLVKLAEAEGKTMAEVIREAVDHYLAMKQDSALVKLRQSEGIWKDRKDMEDTNSYVEQLRRQNNLRLEDDWRMIDGCIKY